MRFWCQILKQKRDKNRTRPVCVPPSSFFSSSRESLTVRFWHHVGHVSVRSLQATLSLSGENLRWWLDVCGELAKKKANRSLAEGTGQRFKVPTDRRSYLFWMREITCEYVFPRTLSPFTFTSRSPAEHTHTHTLAYYTQDWMSTNTLSSPFPKWRSEPKVKRWNKRAVSCGTGILFMSLWKSTIWAKMWSLLFWLCL